MNEGKEEGLHLEKFWASVQMAREEAEENLRREGMMTALKLRADPAKRPSEATAMTLPATRVLSLLASAWNWKSIAICWKWTAEREGWCGWVGVVIVWKERKERRRERKKERKNERKPSAGTKKDEP